MIDHGVIFRRRTSLLTAFTPLDCTLLSSLVIHWQIVTIALPQGLKYNRKSTRKRGMPESPSPLAGMLTLLANYLRWLWFQIVSFVQQFTSRTYDTDTGRSIRVGRQIAEGGFSFVYEAFDVQTKQKYALKRIRCVDSEILRSCRTESSLHRQLQPHPNLMPLLGVYQHQDEYNMLFPYYPQSLRDVVNRRIPDDVTSRAPWKERTALILFYRIGQGVQTMHQRCQVSHRDLKLENILFAPGDTERPVITDFGSAGPLQVELQTRPQVLMLVEQASMHTTLPYRPPELMEGGVRHGDPPIDYAKVDVWSLGCTLFAMLFGASPYESEFGRTSLRIVECTQLRILGDWKRPPEPWSQWYGSQTLELIEWMLTKDRLKRPSLEAVLERLRQRIEELGGTVDDPDHHNYYDEDDSDGIALMNNFV